MTFHWSIAQARIYQLWSVGLHGKAYPLGETGIRQCFCDQGLIQLDPLPVLGRNHDLVVQARVGGTHPGETLDLIHRERLGFEYWNKMLCAIPIEAFPDFRAFMSAGGEAWEQGREERLNREYPGAIETVYRAVCEYGPLSSRELKQLDVAQGEHRGWKSTKVANAALEVLWNRGRISVSHRQNYRRYFDLTERVIPSRFHEAEPPSLDSFWRTMLLRRVQAVGLLPVSGDAEVWALLQRARRAGPPERLVDEGELAVVQVDGIKLPFYALPRAEEELRLAEQKAFDDRVRFIAPLDPLVWARNALARLWDFEYAWEVYKPAAKRRWGYYVLPILYQDRFVARFDGRFDRATKTLHVLAYYEEASGLPLSHPAIYAGFQRFLAYLDGEQIKLPTGGEAWTREV